MAIWPFCVSVALNIKKPTDKENQPCLIGDLETLNSVRMHRINRVLPALQCSHPNERPYSSKLRGLASGHVQNNDQNTVSLV